MSWAVRKALGLVRRGEWSGAGRFLVWAVREQRHERRLGVRTGGNADHSALGARPDECHEYEATSYSALAEVFRRVGPATGSHEVLLDAGCGLGRVLVFAALLPYDGVIGFDLSPTLIERARANLDAIRPRAVCRQLQAEVAAAGDYVVPDTVTTVFCFNPFRGATMDGFLAQVRASLRRRPRPLRLVFVNPKHFDVATQPWLTTLDEFRVFDGRMGPTFDYHQTVRVFRNRQPDGG
jgi:SAM-dependent methyltransferase